MTYKLLTAVDDASQKVAIKQIADIVKKVQKLLEEAKEIATENNVPFKFYKTYSVQPTIQEDDWEDSNCYEDKDWESSDC